MYIYSSFFLSILSPTADLHFRMTSIKVRALPQCLGFAASYVSPVSQSLLYNRYDAIGGIADSFILKKMTRSSGNTARNVQSDLVETVKQEFGQWSFCKVSP